jgi:hypothetical protein
MLLSICFNKGDSSFSFYCCYEGYLINNSSLLAALSSDIYLKANDLKPKPKHAKTSKKRIIIKIERNFSSEYFDSISPNL